MDKGKIGYWRVVVGQWDAGCRRYGANVEDGDHVAFHYKQRAEGRQWTSWVGLESGDRWDGVEL